MGPITAPMSPLAVNTAVKASVSFTDPDVPAMKVITAVWDWGDGTSSGDVFVEVGGSSGTITGSHTYTSAGVYTVKVTVTDNYGGSGQATFQYVVVYDPKRRVHHRRRLDHLAGQRRPRQSDR